MAEDQGNWLALLKWSLAQGAMGDGTVDRPAAAIMSEDDRKFLEGAMRDIVNEPERLREIMTELIALLDTSSDTRNHTTELLLDELLYIIEQIDMAGVFVKFGGVKCLLLTANDKANLSDANRANAVSIIGSLAQNNTPIQNALFLEGIIPSLLCFKKDQETVWSKALFAISCIVKNHSAAEAAFMQQHACTVLSSVESMNSTCRRRCVYLTLALLSNDPSRAAAIASMLVPGVYTCLSSDDVDQVFRKSTQHQPQLCQNVTRTC